MKVAMQEVAGSNVLAGAISGRNALQKLLAVSDLEVWNHFASALPLLGVDATAKVGAGALGFDASIQGR